MKLLVNKDLSAARKDKHLQSVIAYLMLKVASIPGASASNSEGNAIPAVPEKEKVSEVQTAIAKFVCKQSGKVKFQDVKDLFKRMGWNSDLLSPSYGCY